MHHCERDGAIDAIDAIDEWYVNVEVEEIIISTTFHVGEFDFNFSFNAVPMTGTMPKNDDDIIRSTWFIEHDGFILD